jgi:hypothetical protein
VFPHKAAAFLPFKLNNKKSFHIQIDDLFFDPAKSFAQYAANVSTPG